MDVSFITINYNSSNHTKKLVDSIEKYTTNNSYEIIIVDNDSNVNDYNFIKDYIKDKNSIKIIRNDKNLGFSCGNMIGAKYASGDFFLFINNDVELLNDVVKIMINYLNSNKDIFLATADIIDSNGRKTSSYKLFPSIAKALFGNYIARQLSLYNFPSNKDIVSKPTLVEVVSGSFMFFRADKFVEVGGYDKNFFLYCEEEDISKRIWDMGGKVVFIPEAKVLHYGGGSTKKSFEIEREFYISYFILLKKHFNVFSRTILKILLFIKLFRRIFKNKNGLKIFLCFLNGCKEKFSLRNFQ